MKRILLVLAPLVVLAGCVVRTVPYDPGYQSTYQPPPPPMEPAPLPPPAPPARVEFAYFGQHFIPEAYGGGWCYLDGPHTHDYQPERTDWYVQDGGYFYYRGPFEFTYYAGHPLPGGGWCYIQGPHVHDYYPPRGAEWNYRRGYGYVYQGPYRAERPPPAHYWPRPLPPPPRVEARPRGWENRPERPLPPRPEPSRFEPVRRPEPGHAAPHDDERHDDRRDDRRDDRHDGRDQTTVHTSLPPGRGGFPPGQVAPAPAPAPAPPPVVQEPRPGRGPAVRPTEERPRPAEPQKAKPADKGKDRGNDKDKEKDKDDDRRPGRPGPGQRP